VSKTSTLVAPPGITAPLLTQGILQRQCDCGSHTVAGTSCEECGKKQRMLQRKAGRQNDAPSVPPIVHEVLQSPGQPLEASTRAFMEPRFGHDFSNVRIHADGKAAESAKAVNARAFTVSRDIVFGADEYHPSAREGRLLLSHELTHVVQQRGAGAYLARRQTDPAPRAARQQDESDVTARLLKIIADIELLQARAEQRMGNDRSGKQDEAPGKDNEPRVDVFLARLRTVAHSSDEQLKLSVLAGFSSSGVKQAEALQPQAESGIRVDSPAAIAMKSLRLSHPRDPAELEADRVAHAIAKGANATVAQVIPAGSMNRQEEALAGAGAMILAAEAESLPVTSWNPPGWVVLGVATVVALALIGTAVYMASNVADTGIMEEVQRLIEAARAAGTALSICEALAQLMAAAKRAGDSGRVRRIKATEKAKGCRHSSFS
jgi:hypothetical protein